MLLSQEAKKHYAEQRVSGISKTSNDLTLDI